jgi:predicted metallopeptidase
MPRKKKKSVTLEWQEDLDIQMSINTIISTLELEYMRADRIFCYRTTGSSARAYARIWSFPKIFQQALRLEPAYVIEVLSEKFDPLNEDAKMQVLVHELLHIPKNFSGSLLPHSNGRTTIDREARRLFTEFKRRKKLT